MIFAIVDYLKYRFRKGHYAHSSILQEGGRLAAPELYGDLERAHPGDILIYHGSNSILSWLVMYYTDSVWSHTASFGENGALYDATTGGVIKHHFSDYLDENGYIALMTPTPPMTSDEIRASIQWAEKQIGAGFNWWGVLRFWAAIVLGSHCLYRFRYTADFLVLGTFLLPLGFLWPSLGWAILATMGCYCLVVVLTRPRRTAMACIIGPQLRPKAQRQ
jgi:hypothetical protein